MKLYVAGSWRQLALIRFVVDLLREIGHDVYDFTRPPANTAFHYDQIDKRHPEWTREEYRDALEHPLAVAGFESDYNAMQNADGCVLVLPSNRSAHIEAGYFIGAGKQLAILLNGDPACDGNPELMYKMTPDILTGIEELKAWAKSQLETRASSSSLQHSRSA